MNTRATLAFFWLLASQAAPAFDLPFSISLDRKSNASVEAFGVPPEQAQGTDATSASVVGGERSECRDYGRQSASKALAGIRVLNQSADALSLELDANAFAQGGHYRTCGVCIEQNCVGIFGNDTRAKASASAFARVTIEFDKNFPASSYALKIGAVSEGVTPEIQVSDSTGKEIGVLKGDGDIGRISLTSEKGALYYVTMRLPISANSKGGCCDEQKNATSRVDIRVVKAPILAGFASIEPYIRGGNETQAYTSVGAITIDGRLHCTGTAIGTKTILTAAHCLYGYESQIEDMRVVFGSNIFQHTHGPYKVVSMVYPKDSASGFLFNPETLEDDIGLIYVAQALTEVAQTRLHDGDPSWENILGEKRSLVFVGFGYDVIEDQRVAAGIKREAAWTIDRVENRRVTFQVRGKNTCKGDSGGPAFVIDSRKLIQVGITSGGDSSCTYGFETRIDAFRTWLNDKVE